MKSMLDEIGITSYFALLSPVSDGLKPYLPSPRFSHAVLAVPKGSGYRFLDPTAAAVPASYVCEAYQGAPVLVINPGTIDLTTIPFQSTDVPNSGLLQKSG